MRVPAVLTITVLMLASCADLPSGLPDPVGYGGFLELGWQGIRQGAYLDALDAFKQAIEMDVDRADGHLGAAVACLHLEDHRGLADDYFQTAIQQDLGRSAIVRHMEETLIQDTLWTVFECIDKALPGDSLELWLSMTGDSGAVWVGERIQEYLTENGLDTDLVFRFRPGPEDVVACTGLSNNQSGAHYSVDSLSSGWVYLDVPMHLIKIGEVWYYTWIMVGQNVRFDYAVLETDPSAGQITRDALASWTMLEDVRGDEGDLLQAAACSQGLLRIAPEYRFGEGDTLRSGTYDLDIVDVVATGASCAFLEEQYIYAWHMCVQAGYGLALDPDSGRFLLDLLELIAEMRS